MKKMDISIAVLIFLSWIGPAVFGKIINITHAEKKSPLSIRLTKKIGSAMDKDYVLEIIGLGATLDKYRQGAIWDALSKGDAYSTVRETDPKKYPWQATDKMQTFGGREGSTLENGADELPMYWGTPSFNAERLCLNPLYADRKNYPQSGMVASVGVSGMIETLFVIGPREISERPDKILGKIFSFFDENPDVPYVVLTSEDGPTLRHLYRPEGAKAILEDGYYIPSYPDASTLFVLARRERADVLRPFTFKDVNRMGDVYVLNEHGIGRRLFLTYLDLKERVPLPTPKGPYDVGRQPTFSEWLEEAKKFAARPEIIGSDKLNFYDIKTLGRHHPPRNWKPTPWFPVPWSEDQLRKFDSLPTLGFLHRPVFIKTSDERGRPLRQRQDREEALYRGWQEALQTLPEAERAAGPVRLAYSTLGNTEQTINFHGLLRQIAAGGGQKFDPSKQTQVIDTDRRLGDTGATTFFMQMAIGVIGSYREGGVSAALNMRDPLESSLVFISPPPEDKRGTRFGEDPLKNKSTPVIDPRNYDDPRLH
ncbi:DUF2875 family protein [Massilia sp. erpn]|uniref:type VI lipase adapter Tla3 domain-containing protein n=1 Tax=Massilia sp. erpn TaxID=2738142 RepID=UPI0021046789|nr:DUF2875 family protein [Massilia sp. erpn]UTY57446.1 DUF2875 family protein [Massilia sp. erpn]